ncbi:YigZ family protein [[Mycoplasma] collis]|uniref:YigZ family protein n=1 Tax=[Mycoplasma] collis TaxID=2127 RepID=UPI00069155AF|nr:YigZ family protein [[Mycoplasma] collis]
METIIFTINKSKFLPYFFNIKSKDELTKNLIELKTVHKKAKHICYAYIIDEKNKGFFDDKEPKGTAGMPLLKLLEMKKITNGLIVVVRYFGGIKLGAGKLLRSYVKAANLILN